MIAVCTISVSADFVARASRSFGDVAGVPFQKPSVSLSDSALA